MGRPRPWVVQTHAVPSMTLLRRLLPLAVAALVPQQVLGAEIVACIVADTPNNSSYYGMATTVTRLRCEFTNKDYFPTLPELYRQGWRLIQVLGGDQALSQGTLGPSPLYLLEREAVPASPLPSAAAGSSPAAETGHTPSQGAAGHSAGSAGVAAAVPVPRSVPTPAPAQPRAPRSQH